MQSSRGDDLTSICVKRAYIFIVYVKRNENFFANSSGGKMPSSWMDEAASAAYSWIGNSTSPDPHPVTSSVSSNRPDGWLIELFSSKTFIVIFPMNRFPSINSMNNMVLWITDSIGNRLTGGCCSEQKWKFICSTVQLLAKELLTGCSKTVPWYATMRRCWIDEAWRWDWRVSYHFYRALW